MKDWAIKQHENCNHFYDKSLGIAYKFHLQMVVNEIINFSKVATGYKDVLYVDIINAGWGHDLIEDARCTYNDILKVSNVKTAEIIYALTNNKGKNRAARANEEYYKGIKNTPGAAFVKMCDRIANVKFGLLVQSNMLTQYKRENDDFISAIYSDELQPLSSKLYNLLSFNI